MKKPEQTKPNQLQKQKHSNKQIKRKGGGREITREASLEGFKRPVIKRM